MELGKSYTQSWFAMGQYPRMATFTVESLTKSGSARGSYVDADGRKYKRFFVKPEKFGEWTPVAK